MILAHWLTGVWADTVWVAGTWGDAAAPVAPPAVGHWPGGLLYRRGPKAKKREGIKATRHKIKEVRERLNLKPLKDFDPAHDEDAELLAISYWAVGEDY